MRQYFFIIAIVIVIVLIKHVSTQTNLKYVPLHVVSAKMFWSCNLQVNMIPQGGRFGNPGDSDKIHVSTMVILT